ncbi:hypothetical protein CPC08DRAFT_729589 [Agrocybe pediades]|nr:hypothetical protein CPC08DRAFT_729589 [Agrocybe pediades]
MDTIATRIHHFAPAPPPPPPVVVPLDCTDLHDVRGRPLLDREDLDPERGPGSTAPVRSATPAIRFNPYTNPRRSPRSASDAVRGNRRGSSPPSPSPLPSARTSPSPSIITVDSEHNPPLPPNARNLEAVIKTLVPKIARPTNASRQNLAGLLRWDPDQYKSFKTTVALKCNTLLDPKKSFVSQDAEKLGQLRYQVIEEFPDLCMYESAWPLEIAIQSALKNSSAAAKRHVDDPQSYASRALIVR